MDRPRPGEKCKFVDDCQDGYICLNDVCVQVCDPSGKSRFKCRSGEECVKDIGKLGYCVIGRNIQKTNSIQR